MNNNLNRLEEVFNALHTLNYKTVEVSISIASLIKDVDKSEFYDEVSNTEEHIYFLTSFCGVDIFVNTHKRYEDYTVISNDVIVYDFKDDFKSSVL